MSVSNIDTFVLDFSNPATSNTNPERSRVPANFSFELVANNNVRTLSTNGVQSGDDVEGLLYVPTLAAGDPCRNLSSPYIPRNATQLSNLPQTDYPYVAFAPWINAQCMLAFLAAASADSEAFITYLLDNGTDIPPPLVNPVWSLNDGGTTWAQVKFPVYAIPSVSGASIMQQMGLYSGNMTQAPNPDFLLSNYAHSDYVRLYSTFNTGSADHYPTLWAFLLIVLGIVLLIVGLTSCTMRYNQRRARTRLRRRVLAGEVDLESLGIIKPPSITQAEIDALPLVLYTPHDGKLPLPSQASPTTTTTTTPSPQTYYNQPTCPICLDDYTPNKTTVRALPCHHIYHPACIDPHLLSGSALCPVCKARIQTQPSPHTHGHTNSLTSPTTTTTAGTTTHPASVPVITNLMVRRERQTRLLRARRAAAAAGANAEAQGGVTTRAQWIRQRFGTPLLPVVGRGMRAETGTSLPTPLRNSVMRRPSLTLAPREPDPAAAGGGEGQIEMRAVPTTTTTATVLPPPPPPPAAVTAAVLPPLDPPASPAPADPALRREWARRRASALLHRNSVAPAAHSSAASEGVEGVAGEQARVPLWRKVFPGFRH